MVPTDQQGYFELGWAIIKESELNINYLGVQVSYKSLSLWFQGEGGEWLL